MVGAPPRCKCPSTQAACFFSGALGNLARNDVANAAKLEFPAFDIALDLLTVARPGAFGHDHERIQTARSVAFFNRSGDLVVIERDLRNQNNVCAAGDAAVERDPAGVTSHDFDDHDAFVAGRSGVQSIERVHHFGDGRIETERHRRRFNIVVDRFWNADAIDARLLHLHARSSSNRRRRR